jgi:lactoylglutathione lyase
MKTCTLIILTILSISLSKIKAQDISSSNGISLNHIAIHVHNLEKSAEFYENVLGLAKIPEPFNDGLHEWFSMGGKGQLHLIAGASVPVRRDINSHLCFSVRSIEDFIINLNQNKIKYRDWKGTPQAVTLRVDGVKQIYFQDPDGFWIEVNNDGYHEK